MIRHPYTSNIGKIFREARFDRNVKLDPPGYFYGYVEFNNGIIEICKHKVDRKIQYDLTVFRNGYIRDELFKSVTIYREIKEYSKELGYEDMSSLQNLLTNIS